MASESDVPCNGHEPNDPDLDPGSDSILFRSNGCWALDDRTRAYVDAAGFSAMTKVANFKLDRALLHVLTERWRPETHTFHLKWGEMTITLQDVALLLGLPIHGSPVTDTYIQHGVANAVDLCRNLLGVEPDSRRKEIRGGRVKLSWLNDVFSHMDEPENDEQAMQRARAWILHMFGATLFMGTQGAWVSCQYLPLLADLTQVRTYSWGSAVLAHLYRGLCDASKIGQKCAGGCAILLQLWSWEHLHIGRPTLPRHDISPSCILGVQWFLPNKCYKAHPKASARQYYRDELERQSSKQVIWEPYRRRLCHAAPICMEGKDIWRTMVPLIHFHEVEWHQPDRVMRQFGMCQHIPDSLLNLDDQNRLHKIHSQGHRVTSCCVLHQTYIEIWNNRRAHVVIERGPGDISAYMNWYRDYTRRFIGPSQPQPQPAQLEQEPTMACEAHQSQMQRVIAHIIRGGQVAAAALKDSTIDKKAICEEFLKIFRDASVEAGAVEQYNKSILAVIFNEASSGREDPGHARTQEQRTEFTLYKENAEPSRPARKKSRTTIKSSRI